VRKSQLLAAIAAGLLTIGFVVYSVLAQQPGAAAPSAPGGIALLDVTSVFKENEHFKAMTAEMQRDVARAEEVFKKERETVRQLTEELRDHKPGTLEYKNKEEEITTRSTKLNVNIQLQRKEFLQQESKIYYTVYQEIQQEVDYFAANNNIAMVLKFSNEPVDVEKPDDILREINKQVVWSSRALDITPYIKDRLRHRYGAARTAAPPGNPVRQGVPFPR